MQSIAGRFVDHLIDQHGQPEQRATVGGALLDAAHHAASTISERARVKVRMDEEAVTSQVLADLKLGGTDLEIYELSKPEERVRGADWVWYIEGDEAWFRFLVQAKRLHRTGGRTALAHYYDLGYWVGKPPDDRRQVDILLEESDRSNMPAVYVLYNSEARFEDLVSRLCAARDQCDGIDDRASGITLITAETAARLVTDAASRAGGGKPTKASEVELSEASQEAVPWSCLVGCGAFCPAEFGASLREGVPPRPQPAWQVLGLAAEPREGDLAVRAAQTLLHMSVRGAQVAAGAGEAVNYEAAVARVAAGLIRDVPEYVLPGRAGGFFDQSDAGPPSPSRIIIQRASRGN